MKLLLSQGLTFLVIVAVVVNIVVVVNAAVGATAMLLDIIIMINFFR